MPEQEETENTELTLANDNRWYKLATIAGEISDIPVTAYSQRNRLAEQNRRYWHGWLRHCLEEHNDEKTANPLPRPRDAEGKEINLPSLNSDDLEHIQQMFLRMPSEIFIPDFTIGEIDFRRVSLPECCFEGFVFYRPTYFQGAHFEEGADFGGTHFKEWVDFKGVRFKGEADFQGAHFENWTHFEEAHFKGGNSFWGSASFQKAHFKYGAEFERVRFKYGADFQGAHFDCKANFEEAYFEGWARFERMQFNERAHFKKAHFEGEAFFKEVHFKRKADFQSAKFLAETSFVETQFQLDPPLFYGAELHENTDFGETTKNFPPVPQEREQARQHARAYNRLVLIMRTQNRHDEEMRFFSREMRAKRHAEGFTAVSVLNYLYDSICGFGYSFTKAFCWWLGQIVLFAELYSCLCPYNFVSITDDFFIFIKKLFVSFNNSIPVSTLPKHSFEDNAPYCSQWHDVLSVSQTTISTILLALIILTLRNRFRIK